jgi:hypothetical protein
MAPIVRNDPIQQQQQKQYQQAYQGSENARLSKEQQLDDIQRRLQERVKQRQRRTDRWIPPQYAEDAVSQRAAEEQARAAAREARRQQEEERLRREASDAAVAVQFLQGRVRQKASRFADLVETIQENKQNRDPYRSRSEDDVTPAQTRSEELQQRRRRRQQQQHEDAAENYSPYTDNSNRTSWGNDTYDQQGSYGYLPPDVVRVQRGEDSSLSPIVAAEVIVDSGGGEEDPVMVWTAGAEGLFQEPVRATVEEAEYTDVDVDVEELRIEEEKRSFLEEQQRQGVTAAAAAEVNKKDFSSSFPPRDDEYIDW